MSSLQPYYELPGLGGFYFEDSWVLAIHVEDRSAEIEVEAVLTESHPDYGPPRPGEQFATDGSCCASRMPSP